MVTNDQIASFLVDFRKELNEKLNSTSKSVMNFPSSIPDITGKQIYKMSKSGWSIHQICSISGYSEIETKKKYDTYVRNNV